MPAANNGTRFQYTGQIFLPDVALYYYKARIYNPALGRFMQTDPIGYKDDLDLYSYVGNHPMDRTDPTGLIGELFWTSANEVTLTVRASIDSSLATPSFTPTQLANRFANDFSGTANMDGRAVKITAQAIISDKPGQPNTLKVYPTTAGVTPSGREDTNDIGGTLVRLGQGSSAGVASHELGHVSGAGDQYKGGIDVGRKVVTANVPGNQNIMQAIGPAGANSQTLREIVNAPTNTTKCAPGVSNGACKK